MEKSLKNLLSNLQKIPLTSYQGPAFRMHNPVWAWSPLSADGAVKMGGRFNPKGSPALYLGLSVRACVAEVSAGSTTKILDPQMLCSYTINISNGILDLTHDYSEVFSTPWRLALLNKQIPPGWELYKSATAVPTIKGIIVPSYQSRMERNLVLFKWSKSDISVHDPDGKLKAVYGSKLVD